MNFDQVSSLPNYFDRLSDEDKKTYICLRGAFSQPSCKNRRNKSSETFNEIVKALKAFVVQNNSGDVDRALVCGICFLGEAIAINTRQLRLLISKCKSSINGSFQALGYGTVPSGSDCTAALIRFFPFLKDNFSELRQWTIRQKVKETNSLPLQLAQILQSQSKAPMMSMSSQPQMPPPLPISVPNNNQVSDYISPAPEINSYSDFTGEIKTSVSLADPDNSPKFEIFDDPYIPLFNNDTNKCDSTQADAFDYDDFLYGM